MRPGGRGRRAARILWTLALAGAATCARADDVPAGPRDPYLPPGHRTPAAGAPTRGAALQAQVEAKLRARFEAADVGHTGRISAEDARRSGWGYVAARFAEIDRQHEGSVTFAQIRAYVQTQPGSSPR